MCFHAMDLDVYLCITVCIMYPGMPKAQKLKLLNLIKLLRHTYVFLKTENLSLREKKTS